MGVGGGVRDFDWHPLGIYPESMIKSRIVRVFVLVCVVAYKFSHAPHVQIKAPGQCFVWSQHK